MPGSRHSDKNEVYMQKRLRRFFLSCLLFLAFGGCAQMQSVPASTEPPLPAGDQQRITTLQRQLKALQEQLALLNAQRALDGEHAGATARAWQPLFESGREPQGYGLYTYVLLRADDGRPTPAETRLLALLDTLPGRGDLPQAEQNIFLVPVSPAPGPVRLQTDYNLPLAQHYLKLAEEAGTAEPGALLVCTTAPLTAESSQALLVVALHGCGGERLGQILTASTGRYEGGPDSAAPPFLPLVWRLIDHSAPAAFSLSMTDRTLNLGCLDE